MGYVNDYGGFTGEGDPYGGMYQPTPQAPKTPEQIEAERLANRSPEQLGMDIYGQQYQQQLGFQQPYYDLGVQGLGQMGNYTQGENFDALLNEGSRQLRGSALASGLGNSSAAGRQMAGFVNNLTQEDTMRQYQQALNNIKIGQGASSAMGGYGQNYGQQMGGIYGTQGGIAANNALQQGQNSANMWGALGGAVGGLGNYMAYQPQGGMFDNQMLNNPSMNWGGR